MAHFLLYLPKVKGANPRSLEAVGLPDFVANAEFVDAAGPDGDSGVLIAWRRPGTDSRFCFSPDHQDWIPAAAAGDGMAAGRYWLGMWRDSPPIPTELLRPQAYKGKPVQLGDGNSWIMPDSRQLPCDCVLAEDGTWRVELQEAFRPLRDEALAWLDRLAAACAGGETARVSISYGDVIAFLLRMLRLNYRLPPELAGRRRLFNTTNIREPLYAAIGALDESPSQPAK